MPREAYLRNHRVKELTPTELKRIDQLAMHDAMSIEETFLEKIKKEKSLSRLITEEHDEEFLAGLQLYKKILSSALRNKLNV